METTIFEKAQSLIADGAKLLEDEKQIEYFNSVSESLEAAKDMAGEDEERLDRLTDAAIKYVNQLFFILFRHAKLDGELAETFRSLPSPEVTGAKVKEYEDAHQAKIDAINDEQRAVMAERKELDIFLAVISGMTKEQAEQKMAQYEAQIAQMNKQ